MHLGQFRSIQANFLSKVEYFQAKYYFWTYIGGLLIAKKVQVFDAQRIEFRRMQANLDQLWPIKTK